MQVLVRLSFVLGLLTVTTKALPVNETELFKNEPTVDELLSAMQKHDHGIVALSRDGVLRSFAPNQTVLSYAQLSPHQIQSVIHELGQDEKLSKIFKGVNGHDVVDLEQLTHPGKDLLPADFPEKSSDHIEIVTTETQQPPTSENPTIHNRGVLMARLWHPGCPEQEDCEMTTCPECRPYCYKRFLWQDVKSCHTLGDSG